MNKTSTILTSTNPIEKIRLFDQDQTILKREIEAFSTLRNAMNKTSNFLPPESIDFKRFTLDSEGDQEGGRL